MALRVRPPILVLGLLAGPALSQPGPAGPDDPTRVLVVYRTNAPDSDGNGVSDSLDVANLYALRRGVPAGNLLGVTCSPSGDTYAEAAGWTAFWNEMVVPIRNYLLAAGTTSIDTILLCHRIPYRLTVAFAQAGNPVRSVDQAIATIWTPGTFPTVTGFTDFWWWNPYNEPSPTVGTDLGRFSHAITFSGTPLYLVGRIDGPSLQASLDLIDRAAYADLYVAHLPGSYDGNVYVDTRFALYTDAFLTAGYPFGYDTYGAGDQSMAFGKIVAQNHGYTPFWEPYETEIGEAGALFSDGSSAAFASDALLYGGWYNFNIYHDGWEWIPGSAAVDVDSNSGANLWSASPPNFLPNAFLRGLTVGAGCVAEPYLSGHPRPEVFLHYLLEGFTFAEAAMLSDPTARWTSIYVGDPMYNPFRPWKVPTVDGTDPAIAGVECAFGAAGTDRTVRVSLADTGVPEVAVLTVDYGTSPALGSSAGNGSTTSRRPEVALPGLGPSTLYRYEVVVTDPVGRQAAAGQFATYTENPAPTLCRSLPAAQTVPTSSPFSLTLVHSRASAADPILGLSVTFDAPALGLSGLDVTGLVLLLGTEFLASPDGREVAYTFAVPAGLPPGTVTFTTTVTAVTGPAASSGTVAVVP